MLVRINYTCIYHVITVLQTVNARGHGEAAIFHLSHRFSPPVLTVTDSLNASKDESINGSYLRLKCRL